MSGYTQGGSDVSDADFVVSDDYRVVQVNPPGSEASIIFGTGVTSAVPGSVQGLHLVVFDIEKAHSELMTRGAEVSEIFHDATGAFHHSGTEQRVAGPTLIGATTAPSPRSATPMATAGCCRK